MYTPVAFIIFNRPDTTEKVFAEIARAKPPKLFVIADGPRKDHPEDVQKSAAARSIIEKVDWECEVLKNYSDVNLGCGHRPATGISWVFEHVDRAIILEDDCVPHPTFFRFCDELLEKYRDNHRVIQISGNNFQFGRKRTSFSYFFSFYNICFGGWATWRRAWQFYDAEIKQWGTLRETRWLADYFNNHEAAVYWGKIFDQAYAAGGDADYWDHQWTFTCWILNGLTILPNATLVSNIGFREDSTHTKSPHNIYANLPLEEIIFPLKHPPEIVREKKVDQFFIRQFAKEVAAKKWPFPLYHKLRKKIATLVKSEMTIR